MLQALILKYQLCNQSVILDFKIIFRIQTPKQLAGQLSINDRLNNAEVLFKGQLQGPEGFASYNGELYTGVVGGYIMKVTKDKLVPVVKLGKKCGK